MMPKAARHCSSPAKALIALLDEVDAPAEDLEDEGDWEP